MKRTNAKRMFRVWVYVHNRPRICVSAHESQAEAIKEAKARTESQLAVVDNWTGRVWERGLIYAGYHGSKLANPSSDAVKEAGV